MAATAAAAVVAGAAVRVAVGVLGAQARERREGLLLEQRNVIALPAESRNLSRSASAPRPLAASVAGHSRTSETSGLAHTSSMKAAAAAALTGTRVASSGCSSRQGSAHIARWARC